MKLLKKAEDFMGDLFVRGTGSVISEFANEYISNAGKRIANNAKETIDKKSEKANNIPVIGGIVSDTMKGLSSASYTIGHVVGKMTFGNKCP